MQSSLTYLFTFTELSFTIAETKVSRKLFESFQFAKSLKNKKLSCVMTVYLSTAFQQHNISLQFTITLKSIGKFILKFKLSIISEDEVHWDLDSITSEYRKLFFIKMFLWCVWAPPSSSCYMFYANILFISNQQLPLQINLIHSANLFRKCNFEDAGQSFT